MRYLKIKILKKHKWLTPLPISWSPLAFAAKTLDTVLMEDSNPIVGAPFAGARSSKPAQKHKKPVAGPVTFNRKELDAILRVYGHRVAEGEWRDYAMDFLKDVAVFSIFRRASEMPLYRIEKRPKLSRKQGAYSVITPTGLILKRGHDLTQVLRVLEKRKLQAVE